MVEYEKGIYDESSDDSPPLVPAEPAIADLHTLEPIGVAVVTINGHDPLCQASVVSYDSAEPEGTFSRENSGAEASQEDIISSQTWSAGVAGGVVGTLIGGPILGIVTGSAAAYYSQREGAAGDISRAVGEIGRATGQKAKELNDKHQLVDKSKEAAGQAWKKVQEMNEQHHIDKKAKAAASEAWENLKEFDREHGVLQKLSKFALFCLKKLVRFIEHVAQRAQELEPCRDPQPQAQRVAESPISTRSGYCKVEHTVTAY